MHLATAFQILAIEENNFLSSDVVDPSMRRQFRRMVIDMVLATDNEQHGALTLKLENLLTDEGRAGSFELDKNEMLHTMKRKRAPEPPSSSSSSSVSADVKSLKTMEGSRREMGSSQETNVRQLLIMGLALHVADVRGANFLQF